jgi:hypothetical protein
MQSCYVSLPTVCLLYDPGRQVRDSIARNKMNGALEAVWIPELLLLCVALLPLSDIEAALQRGAQAAKAELTAAVSGKLGFVCTC